MFPFFNSQESYFKIFFTYCVILALVHVLAGCGTKDNSKTTNGDPKDSAMVYLSLNHLEEAETAFQKAIKMEPNDVSSYIGLTRLYLLQKN